MAEQYPSPDYGPENADQFPADVLAPAVLAAVAIHLVDLVVTALASPLSVTSALTSPGGSVIPFGWVLGPIIASVVGVVSTIGLVAALLYLVVAGPSTPVLRTGAAIVYVADLATRALQAAAEYLLRPDGWGLGPGILLQPLDRVVLFLGIALALRWYLDDLPLPS